METAQNREGAPEYGGPTVFLTAESISDTVNHEVEVRLHRRAGDTRRSSMTQVFISYAWEEGKLAKEIAHRLEAEGYSTWYFERDAVAGESHLELTSNAIGEAVAFIVIMSKKSCVSQEVNSEFYGARARKKFILPLRYGMSHEEFMAKFATWHAALGGRVEIELSSDVGVAVQAIVNSLRRHKISPEKSDAKKVGPSDAKVPPPPPPPARSKIKKVKTQPSKAAAEPSSRREGKKMARLALPAGGAVLLAGLAGFLWYFFAPSPSVDPPAPAVEPPAPPPKEKEPASVKDLAAILAECEREWKEYVQEDPKEAAKAELKSIADAAQAWADERRKKLGDEKEKLEQQLAAVREMEDQIERLEARIRERPDPSDADAVSTHARLIQEYNGLVDRHRPAVQEYKTVEAEFNRRAEAFNTEFERRQAEIREAEKEASERTQEYAEWVKQGGTAALWRKLCRCFADLKIMERDKPDDSTLLKDGLSQARKLRGEMADHLKAEQDASDSGFLIVKAEIGEEDFCYLMVNIGSTICSLSAEMVDALDLGEFQGSETQLSLPGDIVTHVPQLAIPRIAVGDEAALFVKAVVLTEGPPGTDGSLGLSFLHRFDYTIEGGDQRRLTLRPPDAADSMKAYDVFICHHANDLDLAREVYRVLEEAGVRAFLSQVSLGRMSAAEFQKAIDNALAGATHMVVVCTDPDHLKTPWVEAEWRLFERQKSSGQKQGNIAVVLSGNRASDLPPPLNGYEVLPTANVDWAATLIGRVKP
jgi:hypothetical protein